MSLPRIAALVTAVLFLLGISVTPAAADPQTPSPSPTATPTTPAPANPVPVPDPAGKPVDQAPEDCLSASGYGKGKWAETKDNKEGILWCLPWVWYDEHAKLDAPMQSKFYTTCSKPAQAEEKQKCEASTLTLQSPTPDGQKGDSKDASSVFAHEPRKIDQSAVHCEWFTRKANDTKEETTKEKWTEKARSCSDFRSYYISHLYESINKDSKNDKQCGRVDIPCKVAKGVASAIEKGIRSGMQGLVDMMVHSMVWLLGQLATLVFDVSSPDTPSDAFYNIYNNIAGFMVVLALMFFFITLIVNMLRINGPGPLGTLGGLIRAILGITLAGGIAWLIMRAWDEATKALIDANSDQPYNPSVWIKAMTDLGASGATMGIALLIAVLSILALILLFIVMLFRSTLLVAAALFGSVAMAGQVMPETRHWGRKWFWTVNALASSKFFIAALWIYGSRATYESNNLIAVLQGFLIIVLMVACPYILLRITSMWDGYLSDVNARGFISAIGKGIGIGNNATGTGSSGGNSPSSLMDTNSNTIPTVPGTTDTSGDSNSSGPSAASTGKQPPDPKDGNDDANNKGDKPNDDEAKAIEQGTGQVRGALSQGSLPSPADATGEGNSDGGGGAGIQPSLPQPPATSGSPGGGGGGGGSAAAKTAPEAGAVPPAV